MPRGIAGGVRRNDAQPISHVETAVRQPAVIRALLMLTVLIALPAAAAQETPPPGEAIYRAGMLPSGAQLRGEREAGIFVEGGTAACAKCHRRSGLGTYEGNIVIPPITARYLFREGADAGGDLDVHYAQGRVALNHVPYTDATLARALREGIASNGRALNYLMPRYRLSDADMASLIAYLKGLSTGPVPGVTGDTLHFATIITPDADRTAARGMLDVLQAFFADKNDFLRAGARPMRTSRMVKYRVQRRWQLHVWELTGPPDTWERQLRERFAAEPVFAVISGLGGTTWAPVHRFCEQEAVPCLMPNVDLPVVAEQDFYPVYFSKGILLEAQLIARSLRERSGQSRMRRVVQVFRANDIGAQAAKALGGEVRAMGIENVERRIDAAGNDVAEALTSIGAEDAVILWLRPEDVAALPAQVPESSVLFMSGLMGGLEHSPVPAAWRGAMLMTYPFDLPERRRVRMNYPFGWFKARHIPVVAERVQTDTYLACGVLAETLTGMLDTFVRDYLVEEVENMLAFRTITGYYPRLALAIGQRFASKGGYIVRFAESEGDLIAPEGDWIVP